MRTWAVIGEQIIRHAFTQTRRNRTAFVHNARNLSATAEDLVGCALGHNRDGGEFKVAVKDLDVKHLTLNPFTYGSTRKEGRRHNFSSDRCDDSPRNESQEVTDNEPDHIRRMRKPRCCTATRQAQSPIRLSARWPRLLTIHGGLRFDGFALAAWATRVLIYLRLAYTATLGVDDKRGAARERLREAHKRKGAAANRLARADSLRRPAARQRRRAADESAYLKSTRGTGAGRKRLHVRASFGVGRK